jgi:hypothetical protein
MDKILIPIIFLSLAQGVLAEQVPAALISVEFVFDNKVTHTLDLPSAALRAARKSMVTGGKVSSSQLRALADAGDGLAAYRYGKVLEAADPPAKAGGAAHYYAIAAYTGRAFAVAPLAKLLVAEGDTYGASLLKHSLNALTVQAISGNAQAAAMLGQMYIDGVPFGRDTNEAQHFLSMAGQNDPAAALKLGIALITDPADARLDHVGARAALILAANGTNLSARVTAQNLLRMLDNPTTPNAKVTP